MRSKTNRTLTVPLYTLSLILLTIYLYYSAFHHFTQTAPELSCHVCFIRKMFFFNSVSQTDPVQCAHYTVKLHKVLQIRPKTTVGAVSSIILPKLQYNFYTCVYFQK